MAHWRPIRWTLLITLVFVPCSCLYGAEFKAPNIVFILADDLGIGNVGCYGSDNYRTPNIDRLASGGIRFTHAYTASLCGPSRAMIMSGRYAFRNGSTNQDACIRMDPSEIVLPKLFKSAGFATSAIGKWGQLPGMPGDHGFDDYLRFSGSGVYWNKEGSNPERYLLNAKEKKLSDKEYMPDLMHERAVEFLRANRSKPFFLYYSMSHVHGEIQPTPDSVPESQDLFADNILYMDKLVGKLLAELEALKIRDNTLVLFVGDNGTAKGQSLRSTIGGKSLSGAKGTMLEGGGHVPLIASWPSQLKSGRVCDDLIDSTDFLATFAELTGAKLPEGRTFDGQSFAPQLRGESGKPREWIFNQLASMWYVRDARWKLNELGELFDMSQSPFLETRVTSEGENAAAKEARTRLEAVLRRLDPAGGVQDTGDGTGRHASKAKKKAVDSEGNARK